MFEMLYLIKKKLKKMKEGMLKDKQTWKNILKLCVRKGSSFLIYEDKSMRKAHDPREKLAKDMNGKFIGKW